ncbi:MAG: hypothetical protein IIY02_05940 [Firmicutes bacterium]|nr:hypothetical protein [Bacillota bacterium]
MSKKHIGIVFTVGGMILLLCGLMLLKLVPSDHGVMLVLPYICIGFGCGAFGHGVGDLVNKRMFRDHPELKKQAEIEAKDERNMAVSNRAKGKAFDFMIYLFGGLMLAFVLMGVKLAVVLLLVVAYLIVEGVFIYYSVKYQKEM